MRSVDFTGATPVLRFCRIMLASAALTTALPAGGESLPVEFFTKDDSFGTLKISPDGDFLAATATVRSISTLVFINLENMQIEGGLRARGNGEIADFDWVSNTRIVYTYAQRFLGNAYTTNTGEIFGIDRDGGRNIQLYGYRAGDARTGTRLSRRNSTNASGELLSPLPRQGDGGATRAFTRT